ncbi:hypothetical protein Tco_1299772 [Tanacetum coccineum]
MDEKCEKLVRYFELSTLLTLVVIGPDGKTLHPNVADAVEEYGVIAYPFTPDKFVELEKIEKAKQEVQTLESVLVSGDLDFVLGKDGANSPQNLCQSLRLKTLFFIRFRINIGYTNASWIRNTEDNSSTSGCVFLLGGGEIPWASKKQTCITSSIIEFEFVALTASGMESEWLRNLILEISFWSKPIAPISICCDNAATLANVYSQM